MKNKTIAKCLIVTSFISLMVFVSSCSSGIKGTYVWDNNGYQFSATIGSNNESGPCVVHTSYAGMSTINTSYMYSKYVSDRPQIDIEDVALIDPVNMKVYYSDSDFDAYRNGHPCVKR